MIKTKNLSNIFFSSKASNYLLILFSFFLTISPSISSIIIGLLFLKFLLSKEKKNKIYNALKNNICFSIILFFIFIILSGSWFQKSASLIDLNSSLIHELNKTWVLLFCPLLFILKFDAQTKFYAKYAFIIGLIINVLLGIVIHYNKSLMFLAKTGHYINENYLHGFLDHSDLSILFCFGIFIILDELKKQKSKKVLLFIILILLIFFLLNSYGRTGIVCLVILLPIFFAFKYSVKLNVLISIISIIIIILSFSFSKSFSIRLSNTINEIHDLVYGVSLNDNIERHAKYMSNNDDLGRPISYWKNRIISETNQSGDLVWINHIINSENEKETSLGKRLVLWNIYIQKIKENKFFGKGLGSVKKLKKINTDIRESPHNNYLFVLTEFGIIGLLLFINIFISMIRDFFKSKKNVLKIIFPIMFLLAMWVNDYLFIYNTMAFFSLFSYLLFSTQKEKI